MKVLSLYWWKLGKLWRPKYYHMNKPYWRKASIEAAMRRACFDLDGKWKVSTDKLVVMFGEDHGRAFKLAFSPVRNHPRIRWSVVKTWLVY